eukprot:Cvel_30490.t1-p1 / transcript=Cvel_30490.t1 / gene=Cvel_30490 / organism=Chromera_velia_CCMP2878 / gene_product=hypothetical protein / transcript_product=hypothetical protein / location=Cvel_scaffold4357:1057-1800(-) / protein_length=248 / sequence_SO=supercontig / SO=protein_coding / is_pseudo=false
MLPHQNSVSPITQNALHVPSSRPVSGVQPLQALVIPSGLPQQHAQPQAAPPGSPAQQVREQERISTQKADNRKIPRAPNSPSKVSDRAVLSVQALEEISLSPPRATNAAAAAMPLEALVSPDEGGPSAPRTDGGKNRKRMMSGRETRSPGQGGERMGRKILEEEEDAVRMRGQMLYRTFQAVGEGFLGFRETPVGLPPRGPGRGGGNIADSPSSRERLRRGAEATSWGGNGGTQGEGLGAVGGSSERM